METTAAKLAALLRSARASGARAKDDDERVWELDGTDARVEEVRRQVLEQVLATASPVVIAYGEEAPQQPELAARVSEVGKGRFQLVGRPPLEALQNWLDYGNWQLACPKLPDSLEDLARATAQRVSQFVDENSLEFVIDSFHDDVYWVIGLRKSA
jgi:hypothetical protein